jgi:alpha-ketoglutarate-dependent taurine dioxygenase
MAIAIKNLDAPLGAEIAEIDLSKPLTRADIDAVEAAWRERLVVVFHGQPLSDLQLIAFSRNFGELDPPGPNPYGQPFNKEHPELNVISNVVENGKPIGNLGDGEAVWHADMTYVDVLRLQYCMPWRFRRRRRAVTPISPTCLRPTRACPLT